MDFAMSPYELVRSSACVPAGVLLGKVLWTFRVGPVSTKPPESSTLPLSGGPQFTRYVKDLAWTAPMWPRGVLRTFWEDAESFSEFIAALPTHYPDSGGSLARSTERLTSATPEQRIELIATDLCKGGVNPDVVLPVSLAVCSRAARSGLPLLRSGDRTRRQTGIEPSSAMFRFSVLVPKNLDGEELLRVREEVEDAAAPLQFSLSTMIDLTREGQGTEEIRAVGLEELIPAARDYGEALTAAVDRVTDGDEKCRVMTVAGGTLNIGDLVDRAVRQLATVGAGGPKSKSNRAVVNNGAHDLALASPALVVLTIRASRFDAS